MDIGPRRAHPSLIPAAAAAAAAVAVPDAAPVAASDPALITGLLGRCDALASQRPSVAPSAWSHVG